MIFDPWQNDSILDSIEPLLVNLNNGRHIKQVRYEPDILDIPVRWAFKSTELHSKIPEEELSDNLGIGLHMARATLQAVLQK